MGRRVSCPGCDAGRPFVDTSIVMDQFGAGSRLPRGWSVCTALDGFHAPTTAQEVSDAPPGLQRSPRGPRGQRKHPDELKRGRPREPGEPREDSVRKAIVQLLESLGWMVDDLEQGYRPGKCVNCGHRTRPSTRVTKGLPDMHIAGYGVSWWAEIKRPGGALKDEQREWIRTRKEAGLHVYVLRSVNQAYQLHELVRTEGRLPDPARIDPLAPGAPS